MTKDRYTERSFYEMGITKNEGDLIDPKIEERIDNWIQKNPNKDIRQIQDEILEELKASKDKALRTLPEHDLYKIAEKHFRMAVVLSIEFQRFQYYRHKWEHWGSTPSNWCFSACIHDKLNYVEKVIVDSLIEERDPYILKIKRLQGVAVEAQLNGINSYLDELKYSLGQLRGELRTDLLNGRDF